MRLKNRRTGEVKEVIVGGYPVSGKTKMWECSEVDTNEETGYKSLGTYTSLAELNAEWEDYEEPKEYWYLSGRGEVRCIEDDGVKFDKDHKEIGNYFETKEEAEQAVEKLKAWKRLKDKGFKFIDNKIIGEYGNVSYRLTYPATTIEEQDLDLLFGGEE